MGVGHFLQVDARDPAQLLDRLTHDNGKLGPGRLRLHASQVKHGVYAQLVQAAADAPADPPDFPDLDVFHDIGQLVPVQLRQIAHAVPVRLLLGNVIGQLGQSLGGADAHARGYTGFAQDGDADFLVVGRQFLGDAREIQK